MSCYIPNISVSGLAIFNGNSENHGIIKNGLFTNQSKNKGLITSSGYFDTSAINDTCGKILLSAVFTDSSINLGEVNIGVFLNNSTNSGMVSTAIFDETILENNKGTYLVSYPFLDFKEHTDGEHLVYKYENYFREEVSLDGNPLGSLYQNTNGDLYNGFFYGNYYLNGIKLNNVESPVILISPQALYVNDGSVAQFSVSARGTEPLKYQWYKSNTLIPGATSRLLQLTANYLGPVAETYKVVVVNDIGHVTTQPQPLFIKPNKASIISQTENFSALEGSMVALTAAVSGTYPITYQWYLNSDLIEGATGDAYVISSLNYWNLHPGGGYTLNNPNYTLKVTNTEGDVFSERIYVYPIPNELGVSSLNYPVSVLDGDIATISATLTGTFPANITLLQNVTSYNFETESYSPQVIELYTITLEPGTSSTAILNLPINYNLINSVSNSNLSSFNLVISGSVNSITSTNLLISSVYKPLTEINGPLNISMFSGNVPFSQRRMTTTGTVSSVRWYYNNVLVDEITDLPIYQRVYTYANNGDTFYAVVDGITNSLTSRTATVAVEPAYKPSVLNNPTSVSATDGDNVSFSVDPKPSYIDGGDYVLYQWYVKTPNSLNNFTLINGATSQNYSFKCSYFDNNNLYRVRLSNQRGNIDSTAATLSVSAVSAVIVTQPANINTTPGQNYNFTVSAVGALPINYTWYKNNSALPGLTSNNLTSTAFIQDNNSTFYVSVSNFAGVSVSNTVTLKVV